MKRLLIVIFGLLSVFPVIASASAAVTPTLYPSAEGTYLEWSPKSGSTHYTGVDEATCNGTTDYVATSTTAKRDSFLIALSSIPNNSLITAIAITPCASRAASGGGSATMNAFYRYGGVNSADQGSYAVTGTTPVALATTTYSNLSLSKTSTSTLEIGAVYTSGTKGVRLSRIAVQLTYGQFPSATTSAASSIASTSALLNGTGNPNGTTTSAWFRIATSSPASCNDTFGNLLGTTSLGAGTSSVSYSAISTGLRPNTTYYYCAIASNGYGKSYGSVQTFTTNSAITTISSSLATSTTWSPYGGVYVVTAEIYVYSGMTLTIEPGTIVKFNGSTAGLYMTVGGTLNAVGTASELIYLTSYNDDQGGDTNGTSTPPVAGDWRYIRLEGGTANLTHTNVRYGGAGMASIMLFNNGGVVTVDQSEISYADESGLNSVGGTTTVSNSYIHHNFYGIIPQYAVSTTITDNRFEDNGYGIHAVHGNLAAKLTIATNTFSGHTSRPILASFYTGVVEFVHYNNRATGTTGTSGIEIAGAIYESRTWTRDEMPYVISDNEIIISSGATLTIDPGVIVKLGGNYAGITVEGALLVDSSGPPQYIYLTSIKDDTVGGDTNGDGAATSPAPGNWTSVKTGTWATTTLQYAVARYGGYLGTGSVGILWNNGGALNVYNSVISSSTNYGIFNQAGTSTVIASGIYNNTYGICITGGYASIGSSALIGNSSYGVCNTTGNTIPAEYNYWGTSTGPYHATLNPTGGGDAVSNLVSISPWLEQMHYLYYHFGTLKSAVNSKNINWDWYYGTPSSYSSWFHAGMDTWQTYGTSLGGGVTFATSTGATSTADLLVYDMATSSADVILGSYSPNTQPNTLRFNPFFMDDATNTIRQNAATHELGHAHGLWHSYTNASGNIMNSYPVGGGTTTLGLQDMSDYYYLNFLSPSLW